MIGVSDFALNYAPALTPQNAKKDFAGVQPEAELIADRAAQPAPDAEMAELCMREDRLGFETLYRVHGARMKSIAWNMLRNYQDAEDAVQDTFLKVQRSIHTYNGRSSFSTWVYRILVNTCTDTQRGRKRQGEELSEKLSGRESNVPLRIALDRALSRLSEKHRTVFLLAEVEGLTHLEIAGVLDIPLGTSKGWLFEARRELQRLLSEGDSAVLRRVK